MSNIVTRSMAKQACEQEALKKVKLNLNQIRKSTKYASNVIYKLFEELHKYPELSKYRIYRIPGKTYTTYCYEFPPDVWESISGLNKNKTIKFMEKVEKKGKEESIRNGGYGGYYGGWISYTPKYLTTTYEGQKPEFDDEAEHLRDLDWKELIEEERKFDEAIEKEEMVCLHSGC